MSENNGERGSIASAAAPRTRSSLASDLRSLGVQEGMAVMLHVAMSRLGWVSGGPVAVIQALLDVLTEEGTLAMPAFSGDLSDPARWQHPPVPESWWQVIRDTLPAFDPGVTPTRNVGQIAETFRAFPGVLRSQHPAVSVCAWGKYAKFVTAEHSLSDSMGENSPVARLYDLGAFVLLLGTERNSSLHLAEHRSGKRRHVTQGAPMFEDGARVWKTYQDLDYDDDSFPPVKAAFEAAGRVRIGSVGSATAKLMPQRDLVDFAAAWFRERA